MLSSFPSRFASVATAVFGLMASLSPSAAESWPVFRGNAAMTGVASDALAPPLKLAWTFETGEDGVIATAAIMDKVVYIGSQSGVFHAVDLEKGTEIWKYETKGKIEGSACVVGDAVVFGSGDGYVYALNRADGAFRWKKETEGEVMGGANYFRNPEDGETYIIIGSYDYTLYCYHLKTGNEKWNFPTTNYVNGATCVIGGKIYFGGCDSMLHIVSAVTGDEIDSVEIGSYVMNTVAVLNGVAYIGNQENDVVAIDLKTKKEKWRHRERDFEYWASPAVTEKAVFAGSRDRRVYRINPENGDTVWEFKTGKPVDSSPVVSGDIVWFGSDDGRLYALTVEGEEKWAYEIGAEVKSSPAISGKWLVIGADDGNVYGFRKE